MEENKWHIRKKWDKETMLKMLDKLRSTLPDGCVDRELFRAGFQSNSEIDVLYIAYYNLKDSYCKLNRRSFGKAKYLCFEPTNKIQVAVPNCDEPSYGTYTSTTATTYTVSWISPSTTTTTTTYWEPLSGYYYADTTSGYYRVEE